MGGYQLPQIFSDSLLDGNPCFVVVLWFFFQGFVGFPKVLEAFLPFCLRFYFFLSFCLRFSTGFYSGNSLLRYGDRQQQRLLLRLGWILWLESLQEEPPRTRRLGVERLRVFPMEDGFLVGFRSFF